MSQKNRVIFCDWGVYLHKSVYACTKIKESPTSLTMAMIIGDLKKVGVTPDDTVIIACDSHGKGNWRKDLDEQYKSTRRQKREDSGIDWETNFCLFENLLTEIEFGSPFHVVQIDRLEADDIISAGTRFYKDSEVVIISHDSDYEQLFLYPNVKIFSPKSKKYKTPVSNPLSILEKKIKKEASDDLTAPVITDEQYRIRKIIVNLLELPTEIETKVIESLSTVKPKESWDLNKITSNKIRFRFSTMYNDTDKIVDYEKCVEKKKSVKKFKSKNLI